MKKQEIYDELNKATNAVKDFVLVNDEAILQNVDLNDEWLGLTDYSDDEETFKSYSFEKVNYVDGDVFKKEDGTVIDVDFKQPDGCVIRYEVK